MADDPYAPFGKSASGFGTSGAEVTPSDTVDLGSVAKAIVVSDITGGAVLSILPAGSESTFLTFTGVTVGFIPPYRVRRVHTDTTCTVCTVDGG